MKKIPSTLKITGGISLNRVVNQTFLKQIKENSFKCNICYNIIVNPYDCEKCGHSFCYTCINKLKCPFNCKNVTIKPSSKGIKIMLSKLFFKCQNEGCIEKIQYINLAIHEKECIFQKVKCTNQDCQEKITMKDLNEHTLNKCEFTIIICEICNKNIKRYEKEKHSEKCKKKLQIEGDNKANQVSEIIRENQIENKVETSFKSLADQIQEIWKILIVNFREIKDESEKILSERKKVNSEVFLKSKGDFNNLLIHELIDKITYQILPDYKKKFYQIIETSTMKVIQNLDSSILTTSKVDLERFNSTLSITFNSIKNALENSLNSKNTSNELSNYDGIFKETKNNTDIFESIQVKNKNLLIEIFQIICESLNNQKRNTEEVKTIENLVTNIQENMVKLSKDKLEEVNTSILSKSSGINSNIFVQNLDEPNNLSNSSKKNLKEIKNILEEEFESILQDNDDKTKIISEKIFNEILKIKAGLKNPENFENLKNNYVQNDTIKKLFEEFAPDTSEIFSKSINLLVNVSFSDLFAEINKTNKDVDSLIDFFSTLLNQLDHTQIENVNLEESIKLLESSIEPIEIEEYKNNDSINGTIETQIDKSQSKISYNDEQNQTSTVLFIETIFNKFMETKLKQMEIELNQEFDKVISIIYDLKWCDECRKVDYFFGFIKCELCLKEKCKECVVLCKGCKKLFCKKCNSCGNCQASFCVNCRDTCDYCEEKNKKLICQECLSKCLYCKKLSCASCTKKCQDCKGNICKLCSKTCNFCDKCSCSRCENSKTFKFCVLCKKNPCEDCSIQCESCDFEICKNCYLHCKNCKKLICSKCQAYCSSCKETFCFDCSEEMQSTMCKRCRNFYCSQCSLTFKKCKKCLQSVCKSCLARCKRCETNFCKDCSINCDNCDEYACFNCLYVCVCNEFVFCQSCLFNNTPVGPHECVNFLNDSPYFTGVKTRSQIQLPKNFEAKFNLEQFNSPSLLIGVTDNFHFEEDSNTYIDNIWTFKVKTGQKYSSSNLVEPYYDKVVKQSDFIIVALKNNSLYFRVNFDDTIPAYNLDPNKNYYIYIENDSPHLHTKVSFVYIRKI